MNTFVEDYYGKVLNTSKDLATSACTAAGRPPTYILDIIKLIPKEVLEKFYGCGNPIPVGINCLSILDLGSGSGRDCYIASKLVGGCGKVIGVDMTDEQLDVARQHADEFCKGVLNYSSSNMTFLKGYIEDIAGCGVKPQSIDVAISNCVVNLSPDKKSVLKGVYDSLKEGGEFYFSDVYCDRRLDEVARSHKLLWGECISGALYVNDFENLCREVGFRDPRVLFCAEIDIKRSDLKLVVGSARFYSIGYRLFKISSLEKSKEDYGQIVKYKGSIPEAPLGFELDISNYFEAHRPYQVDSNTAAMLGKSYLSKHFEVLGHTEKHFGRYNKDIPNGADVISRSSKASPSEACVPKSPQQKCC